MEILDLHLSILRNEEHYKFQLDFMKLVNKFDAVTLGISPLFIHYQSVVGVEAHALDVVRGSAYTDQLSEADTSRDTTCYGLSGIVKASLNHFNPEIRVAAERLKKLLDTYGSLAEKPYDQETAGIYKLVSDLQGDYLTDATTVGIAGWTEELSRRNVAFDELKNLRYADDAAKPQENMKQARKQTDKAYRAIVKRIGALIELNGETVHAGFVNELNQRIVNYNNLLAQRRKSPTKGAGQSSSNEDTTGK